MSVLQTFTPDITLYIPNPTYGENLPVGHWKSEGFIAGDASGGIVTLTVQPVGAEGQKYLWSLEDITAGVENPGVAMYVAYRLSTGEITPFGVLVFHFGGNIQPVPTIPIAVDEYAGRQPYNLSYIHQPKQPYTNSYSVIYEFNVNTKIYYIAAWGYLWLPQARRLAGGPKRP